MEEGPEMIQPRIIDINRWWRTGGTDYPELKASCDIAIIQGCAGTIKNEVLEEQVEGCRSVDLDYETFCVPSAYEDPEWMADFYLDLYGVAAAPKWVDIEPTGGRMVNVYQAKKFIDRIDSKSPGPAGYYSGYPYTKELGNPAWIKEMSVWWAEYPYQYLTYKYREFGPFLAKKPWWLPKWAARLGISPILHQFTDKGKAQQYGANATTDHPKYKTGIKSADLNVGLVDLEEYRAIRFAPYGAHPTPDPEDVLDQIIIEIATLNYKVDMLWADHYGDDVGPAPPPEEPVTPPEEPLPTLPTEPPLPADVVPASITKEPHTVAWAVTSWKDNGVPVIETNAFVTTNDPRLKFARGSRILVKSKAITSDGNQKWFELYGVDTHSYPALYVRKDDVMKLA